MTNRATELAGCPNPYRPGARAGPTHTALVGQPLDAGVVGGESFFPAWQRLDVYD